MPPLPEAIILVLAPFAPLFSRRVWRHTQLLLLGAILAPGARTVTAALRAMGLATERHFTNYPRVLNRATWSTRRGVGFCWECWSRSWSPQEPRSSSGRTTPWNAAAGQITAKGCYRDAVRSPGARMASPPAAINPLYDSPPKKSVNMSQLPGDSLV